MGSFSRGVPQHQYWNLSRSDPASFIDLALFAPFTLHFIPSAVGPTISTSEGAPSIPPVCRYDKGCNLHIHRSSRSSHAIPSYRLLSSPAPPNGERHRFRLSCVTVTFVIVLIHHNMAQPPQCGHERVMCDSRLSCPEEVTSSSNNVTFLSAILHHDVVSSTSYSQHSD